MATSVRGFVGDVTGARRHNIPTYARNMCAHGEFCKSKYAIVFLTFTVATLGGSIMNMVTRKIGFVSASKLLFVKATERVGFVIGKCCTGSPW